MPLPSLPPSPRIADQVFEAIRAAILSGELPVGHHLRIRTIAEELGTSVMPVRDAITRLREAGLVESIPYRGAVVKGFGQKELLDLYAVRRVLESAAASAAVPRLTDDDLQRMRDAFRTMRERLFDGDVPGYLEWDERFLAVLYGASGNDVALEMIRSLWGRCVTYKLMGTRRDVASGAPDPLLTMQEQILAAASAGDAELTRDLTLASIDAARERIGDVLKTSAAPA